MQEKTVYISKFYLKQMLKGNREYYMNWILIIDVGNITERVKVKLDRSD